MTLKTNVKRTFGEARNIFEDTFGTNEVFLKNETEANYMVCNLQLIFVVQEIVALIMCQLKIYYTDLPVTRMLFLANIAMTLAVVLLCWRVEGKGKYLKNLLMASIILGLAINDSVLTYSVVLGMAIPVVLSIRYYNWKYTIAIAIVTTILFGISQYAGTIIGTLDMNCVSFAEDTVIEVKAGGYLDTAVAKHGFDNIQYATYVMGHMFTSKFLVFILIAIASARIAYSGRRMVLEQNRIAKDHGRIDAELNVAKTIQKRALPIVHELDAHPSFDLAATMTPAKEVGGDFYDFEMMDETHLALIIADVSGKGVPAAMLMMVSKLLLDSCMEVNKSPAAVLAEVNHQLCVKNLEDMFVTVWLGIIDLETGDITAANAGHEYPIICRKGGHYEKYKDPHGLVLGGMDGMRYRDYHLTMQPGDTLFLYTDGVPEANNAEGGFYGMDRLCRTLDRISSENMEQLLLKLHADIDTFAGGTAQFDDITMMGFRLLSLLSKDGLKVIPNKESVPKVEGYIESLMEEKGVPTREMYHMNIAVDEIYSNIVLYSLAKTARVQVRITDAEICVELRDNGIPFNPLSRQDPDEADVLAEDKIGGLGIFMTKQLMDDVSYRYEEGCNVTTLLLKRGKDEKTA